MCTSVLCTEGIIKVQLDCVVLHRWLSKTDSISTVSPVILKGRSGRISTLNQSHLLILLGMSALIASPPSFFFAFLFASFLVCPFVFQSFLLSWFASALLSSLSPLSYFFYWPFPVFLSLSFLAYLFIASIDTRPPAQDLLHKTILKWHPTRDLPNKTSCTRPFSHDIPHKTSQTWPFSDDIPYETTHTRLSTNRAYTRM